MVVRVWGKCNSQDIIFTQAEAGRWTAAVPASPTGTYIIELWAEDEAGNVGYFATIQVTYDPNKLVCQVELLAVGEAFTVAEVMQALHLNGISVSSEVVQREAACALVPDKLRFQILEVSV